MICIKIKWSLLYSRIAITRMQLVFIVTYEADQHVMIREAVSIKTNITVSIWYRSTCPRRDIFARCAFGRI